MTCPAISLWAPTPRQQWQQIKIQWAQILLRERSLTIQEVAWRVGYNDPFYFSNVFHRIVGQRPRAWRQQQHLL